MSFRKLKSRFKEFGGFQLAREYARLGLIPIFFRNFFRCIWERKSFKAIYPAILRRVEPLLGKKYECVLRERKAYYDGQVLEHHRSKIVWFCWLQGLDQAPDIVKVCYRSLKRHLTDREIILIDADNWREYVELPEYVVEKWKKSRIPPANFSDLLRLELLIRYGGTWIDATVLCTGNEHTKEYLDADLFLFQYSTEGTKTGISISNWFITACTNNEVLLVLRDMLYAYWKDYDCTLDYYIFHLFFEMLAEAYPDEIAAMPYGNSARSLILLHHWKEDFDPRKWDKLVSQVSFHKLTHRIGKVTLANRKDFYHRILEVYVDINNRGQWAEGLLSNDGVHPTRLGSEVMAQQVLTDFPEIKGTDGR